MPSICVFAGSSVGGRPEYADAARRLGCLLARRGWPLVYGGGAVGLMGVLADAVLAEGGSVVGVIPDFLASREIAHAGLTELFIVETMHARKALMAGRADAFIAIPGGLGTLDELFEMLTWGQLGLHTKPCGLLNVAGYYDGMIRFLDAAVDDGFVRWGHRARLAIDDDPVRLLDRLFARMGPCD
jgi:uncharacterized protein (TIGR00730 family)